MIHRASAIFISTADRAYLSNCPKHNRGKARDMVDKLKLGIFLPNELVAMEDALCPDYQLAVGAYDRGLYFSFPDEMYGCIENLKNPILNKLLKLFPKSHLLAIELNRTKNYFGYLLYRHGKLERRLQGDMVRGIVFDEGTMQPEEKPHFDKSIVKEGHRLFPSTAALRAPWECIKAAENKAVQDKSEENKSEENKSEEDKSEEDKSEEDKSKEDKLEANKSRENKSGESEAIAVPGRSTGESAPPDNKAAKGDPEEEMYVYGETLVSAMMASFLGAPEKHCIRRLQVELFD